MNNTVRVKKPLSIASKETRIYTYHDNIFINCPFDDTYNEIFDAIVFAVFDCGFQARCSKEIEDSSQIRIEKIFSIIRSCKYGIHDISRTELDPVNKLPRFNMPLELGMFLAAKKYGAKEQKHKSCLVVDKEEFRYQKFISDIAGQDIQAHNNEPAKVIKKIRNWLSIASKRKSIPGASEIHKRYETFKRSLPTLCKTVRIEVDELTFNDYATIVSEWLKENP